MTGALKKRIEKMERSRAPAKAEGGVHDAVRSALEFHASLGGQELDESEESEAEIEAFFDWVSEHGKPGKTD